MRYLKLASAENPYTDYIELNDFYGFLCTSFQNLGISRSLEFLPIKNRRFIVDNKANFNQYVLTIEILSKYSEYEAKYKQLTTFINRNKNKGFRLYYRPYDGLDNRYCLCNIEKLSKSEKMQPLSLVLSQCSLWFGNETIKSLSSKEDSEEDNIFAFTQEDSNGYYCAKFLKDDSTFDYCIGFSSNSFIEAIIQNESYNNIPLNIKIYGPCTDPEVFLYDYEDNSNYKKFKINYSLNEGQYVYINSKIGENGVFVTKGSDNKEYFDESIVDSGSSPYFYVPNGKYIVRIIDKQGSNCTADIFYQEEYDE